MHLTDSNGKVLAERMSLSTTTMRLALDPLTRTHAVGLAFDQIAPEAPLSVEAALTELRADATTARLAAQVYGDLGIEAQANRISEATMNRDQKPSTVDVPAVTISHAGVAYTVAPVEREGRPALRAYAEVATTILPDAPRLERSALAVLALAFLEEAEASQDSNPHVIGRVEPWVEVPVHALSRRRPDPRTVLTFMRHAYAAGQSPRALLAKRYDVSPRTVDDWMRDVRRLPEAADLPPARPGRPRKPKTKDSDR